MARSGRIDPAWSKVVDAKDVESLTLQGWRIDRTLEESYVEPFHETTPFAVPGQTYTMSGSGTKGFLVTRIRFLMTLDELSATAQLRVQMEQAEQLASSARKMQTDAEEALKKQQAEVLRLEGLNTRAERENTRLSESYNDAQKMKIKMENDISKIRTAIGDLKMKEIIGS